MQPNKMLTVEHHSQIHFENENFFEIPSKS